MGLRVGASRNLKAFYMLTRNQGLASTSSLAVRLGVSTPAVIVKTQEHLSKKGQ